MCTPDASIHTDSRPYYEIKRNILNMTWKSTGKYIFAEKLHKMECTLILMYLLRLYNLFNDTVDITTSWA
jgi:hypothetical protein